MPDFFEGDLARYRALSASDLQSAVERYLPRDRRVELIVMPASQGSGGQGPRARTPAVTRTTLLLSALAVAAVGMVGVAQRPDRSSPPTPGPPPTLRLPAIQKQSLSNGLRVWIVEHHEVPLTQVNLVLGSGSAADPAGKFGVASFTAAMLDEGAGSRSAIELADAIDFLGATLSTSSSFDQSAVRLSAPVAKLSDALALMADVAFRPTFPVAEIDRLRTERLTQLVQARDDPEALIQVAFPRIVYGSDVSVRHASNRVRGGAQGAHARRSRSRSIVGITAPTTRPCSSSATSPRQQ